MSPPPKIIPNYCCRSGKERVEKILPDGLLSNNDQLVLVLLMLMSAHTRDDAVPSVEDPEIKW